MNNDELKKKILSIVRGAMLEADELPFIETTDNIADALIAAGIGDVETVQNISASATAIAVLDAAQAKHRAEVAEKALKHAVNVYIAHTETSSKKKWWYKYFLREAEKELAEERNVKN